jgi:hypothetical protein
MPWCIQIEDFSTSSCGRRENVRSIVLHNIDWTFGLAAVLCKIHPTTSHSWTKRETKQRYLHRRSQPSPRQKKERDRANGMWRPYSVFSPAFEVWYLTSSFAEIQQWIKNYFWPFYGLCEKVREKRPDLETEHASATTHATRSIQQFNAINKIPSLPQALHSSNLSLDASFSCCQN